MSRNESPSMPMRHRPDETRAVYAPRPQGPKGDDDSPARGAARPPAATKYKSRAKPAGSRPPPRQRTLAPPSRRHASFCARPRAKGVRVRKQAECASAPLVDLRRAMRPSPQDVTAVPASRQWRGCCASALHFKKAMFAAAHSVPKICALAYNSALVAIFKRPQRAAEAVVAARYSSAVRAGGQRVAVQLDCGSHCSVSQR